MNKRIIGHTNHTMVSDLLKLHMLDKQEKPRCKLCNNTEGVMSNGYCVLCEEELEQQAK